MSARAASATGLAAAGAGAAAVAAAVAAAAARAPTGSRRLLQTERLGPSVAGPCWHRRHLKAPGVPDAAEAAKLQGQARLRGRAAAPAPRRGGVRRLLGRKLRRAAAAAAAAAVTAADHLACGSAARLVGAAAAVSAAAAAAAATAGVAAGEGRLRHRKRADEGQGEGRDRLRLGSLLLLLRHGHRPLLRVRRSLLGWRPSSVGRVCASISRRVARAGRLPVVSRPGGQQRGRCLLERHPHRLLRLLPTAAGVGRLSGRPGPAALAPVHQAVFRRGCLRRLRLQRCKPAATEDKGQRRHRHGHLAPWPAGAAECGPRTAAAAAAAAAAAGLQH
jgi:hypothetical protein